MSTEINLRKMNQSANQAVVLIKVLGLIILWSQVQVLVGPPEMKIPTFGLVFF